ncbi:sporulation protein YjcZ [Paenibacillus riograndensis]|uniref:Putative membrane protein n=1 Tax=Paenibacillus riograndensis SBR5 TaxID=1073571 RepID=A0A0E3WGY5_9BACL|nr:putative membrane protein [Paenibacillus riograndensis SBR5]
MSGLVGGYGCEPEKEVKHVSPFTSTSAILVLFILLVIITKACIF